MSTWVERAELAVDLAPPFLGVAAVSVVAPDALGTLAVVGWLVAVLDAYLGRLFVIGATTSQRLHRLIAPVIVALEQPFLDGGWVSWALDGAVCGMVARSIALSGFFVAEMARRRPGWGDVGMVLPGLSFIVGAWVATLWVLGQAWLHLQPSVGDAAAMGAGLVSAVTADLRRMPDLGARGEPEGAEVMIVGVLGAWVVACGLGAAWAWWA
jgi:hypothetical protein